MDVLLVEDNPGDVRLMQVVFQEIFTSVHLHVANNGLEALAFLRRLVRMRGFRALILSCLI
jgi:CheY-like chemotaxis protein